MRTLKFIVKDNCQEKVFDRFKDFFCENFSRDEDYFFESNFLLISRISCAENLTENTAISIEKKLRFMSENFFLFEDVENFGLLECIHSNHKQISQFWKKFALRCYASKTQTKDSKEKTKLLGVKRSNRQLYKISEKHDELCAWIALLEYEQTSTEENLKKLLNSPIPWDRSRSVHSVVHAETRSAFRIERNITEAYSIEAKEKSRKLN